MALYQRNNAFKLMFLIAARLDCKRQTDRHTYGQTNAVQLSMNWRTSEGVCPLYSGRYFPAHFATRLAGDIKASTI